MLCLRKLIRRPDGNPCVGIDGINRRARTKIGDIIRQLELAPTRRRELLLEDRAIELVRSGVDARRRSIFPSGRLFIQLLNASRCIADHNTPALGIITPDSQHTETDGREPLHSRSRKKIVAVLNEKLLCLDMVFRAMERVASPELRELSGDSVIGNQILHLHESLDLIAVIPNHDHHASGQW